MQPGIQRPQPTAARPSPAAPSRAKRAGGALARPAPELVGPRPTLPQAAATATTATPPLVQPAQPPALDLAAEFEQLKQQRAQKSKPRQQKQKETSGQATEAAPRAEGRRQGKGAGQRRQQGAGRQAPNSEGSEPAAAQGSSQRRPASGDNAAAVAPQPATAPSSAAAGTKGERQGRQQGRRRRQQRKQQGQAQGPGRQQPRRQEQQQQQPQRDPQSPAAAAVAAAAAAVAAVSAAAGSKQDKVGTEGGQAPATRAPKKPLRADSRKGQLTPKAENLMRWYSDAVRAAERCSPVYAAGPAKDAGFAAALQEPIKGWLDERLEYMGFDARPFPQLRPLSLPLRDEPSSPSTSSSGGSSSSSQADAQEQQGAGEAGPAGSASSEGCTSRTFAQWAQAAGGLPVLASQWHEPAGGRGAWELGNPLALLHEAHAAHEWEGTAQEHAQAMIEMYEQFAREVAGLPAIAGRRPPRGTLRGAAATFSLDAMVGEGRALQVAASHHLADNFSRHVDAPYRGSGEEAEYASQMGSGLQASLLGGLVLAHGDDRGVRLPPALAPVQVVVVPVLLNRCDKAAVAAEAERIREVLAAAGVRVALDGRDRRPGRKFGTAERSGVPLRIEVGPRDVNARTCVIALRDQPPSAPKMEGVSTEAEALACTVRGLLEDAQSELRWRAEEVLQCNIVDVTSFYELKDVIEAGKWARGPWAGGPDDEAAVRAETGASLLCYPLQQPVSMWSGYNTCLYSGYQAAEVAIFGRLL